MKSWICVFEVSGTLDEVIECARDELQRRRFRMLDEFDVADMVPIEAIPTRGVYRVVLLTHPAAAYLALRHDARMGAMLVWSVAFHEDGDTTVVAMARPTAACGEFDRSELRNCSRRLEHALAEALRSTKDVIENGVTMAVV
jgi:uncharacterized protein (DUF302 family)